MAIGRCGDFDGFIRRMLLLCSNWVAVVELTSDDELVGSSRRPRDFMEWLNSHGTSCQRESNNSKSAGDVRARAAACAATWPGCCPQPHCCSCCCGGGGTHRILSKQSDRVEVAFMDFTHGLC